MNDTDNISDKLGKKALFLDRDGVINQKIEDSYVADFKDFHFIEGVLEAFQILSVKFDYIFIVTNQQGIGKNLMTKQQLDSLHTLMLQEIYRNSGRVDNIFVCPHHANMNCICRKPKIGLYEQALKLYPEIITIPKVMVGDTFTDMMFGKNTNMTTVLISSDIKVQMNTKKYADFQFDSLINFAKDFT